MCRASMAWGSLVGHHARVLSVTRLSRRARPVALRPHLAAGLPFSGSGGSVGFLPYPNRPQPPGSALARTDLDRCPRGGAAYHQRGMRIAVVENARRGGLLHYAVQFGDALAARGHEVDLLTAKDHELV